MYLCLYSVRVYVSVCVSVFLDVHEHYTDTDTYTLILKYIHSQVCMQHVL